MHFLGQNWLSFLFFILLKCLPSLSWSLESCLSYVSLSMNKLHIWYVFLGIFWYGVIKIAIFVLVIFELYTCFGNLYTYTPKLVYLFKVSSIFFPFLRKDKIKYIKPKYKESRSLSRENETAETCPSGLITVLFTWLELQIGILHYFVKYLKRCL